MIVCFCFANLGGGAANRRYFRLRNQRSGLISDRSGDAASSLALSKGENTKRQQQERGRR